MTMTQTQTNSDGDVLIWQHSDAYASDETPEAGSQDCATCELPVDLAGACWTCTDNGEVKHEDCDLPDW